MKKNIKPILLGIAIVAVILLVWNFVIKKIQERNDPRDGDDSMLESIYATFGADEVVSAAVASAENDRMFTGRGAKEHVAGDGLNKISATTGFGLTDEVKAATGDDNLYTRLTMQEAPVDVAVFSDTKPTVLVYGIDRGGAARALMAGMAPEVVVNNAASAVVVSQERAKIANAKKAVMAKAAKEAKAKKK